MQLNKNSLHIGIAGPVDLTPLQDLFSGQKLPATYSFPLVGSLARELIERGHKVSIFSTSTQITSPAVFTGSAGASIYVIPQRPRRAAYDFYAQERGGLAEAMLHAGCDVVHAHWTYEFAAAALDAKQNCLITAHDAPQAILRYFVATRSFPFWFAKFLLGASVVRKAQRLTAVSPYCAESVKKFFFPHAEITVVSNGIETDILTCGRERLQHPKSYGVNPRISMVLEGFQKRKNAKPALRAFAEIRESFPLAELHLMGSGYGPGEEAQSWAASAGLSDGVFFKGKVPHADLISFLRDNADLLIHPALEESFGMAPLEAMALGIPVVGGKSAGAIPYVLDNGKAGVLVDARNAHELASAGLKLLSNDEFRRSITEAAWARANSEFAFGKMVDRYEACYDNACASPHRQNKP